MFRCQICGQVSGAGTRANKVVLVSRAKNYTSRGGHEGFQRRFRGVRPPKVEYDKGGKGHEIVREVLACEPCASRVKPVIQAAPVGSSDHDDYDDDYDMSDDSSHNG